MILRKNPPRTLTRGGLGVLLVLNPVVLPFAPALAQVEEPAKIERPKEIHADEERAEGPSLQYSPSLSAQLKMLVLLNTTLRQLRIDNERNILKDEHDRVQRACEKQRQLLDQMSVDAEKQSRIAGDVASSRFIVEIKSQIEARLRRVAKTANLSEQEAIALRIVMDQGYLDDIDAASKLRAEDRLTPEESQTLTKLLNVIDNE